MAIGITTATGGGRTGGEARSEYHWNLGALGKSGPMDLRNCAQRHLSVPQRGHQRSGVLRRDIFGQRRLLVAASDQWLERRRNLPIPGSRYVGDDRKPRHYRVASSGEKG